MTCSIYAKGELWLCAKLYKHRPMVCTSHPGLPWCTAFMCCPKTVEILVVAKAVVRTGKWLVMLGFSWNSPPGLLNGMCVTLYSTLKSPNLLALAHSEM